MKLIIYCDDYDFSALCPAFEGEFESDTPLSAEIIITDEEYIRRLNRETRSTDSVTDVLSFPSLEGILGVKIEKNNFKADLDEQGNVFIGSIAICKTRAMQQAEEYGHGFEREINYLAVHGLCHLLGYDHIDEADRQKMRAAEERVLKRAGVERI